MASVWQFITLILVVALPVALILRPAHDAKPPICDERAADGRYMLQHVELSGDETDQVRLMVDNHNRILTALCNR